jgi:hypothetical protein
MTTKHTPGVKGDCPDAPAIGGANEKGRPQAALEL